MRQHQPITPHECHLCLPDPLDALSQTHVICLKFVQSDANKNSSGLQCPVECLPRLWQLTSWDVIGHDGFESNVRMNENGCAEDGICGWVECASGEGCDGQWDDSNRDQTLECPVVGTVCGRWVWDVCGIVGYIWSARATSRKLFDIPVPSIFSKSC